MKLLNGFMLFFHVIILLFITSPVNATDKQALISFKSVLIDPLGFFKSWNDSIPFCNWQGVTCGRRHPDRVTALILHSLQLTGPISPNIFNLTFLMKLRLDDNNLNGGIPNEISRLSRLKILTLSWNQLSGEIPYVLALCSNLEWIDLLNNEFSGEIPRNIGLLTELEILNFGRNNLTGSIPPSIGNITSLFGLELRENQLEGTIPESMGQLSNLQLLQVFGNKLSGEIPLSLYNISSLTVLAAGSNDLTGTLPLTMFNTLPSLTMLLLSDNKFHGFIPISLPNASNLKDFELSDNSFSGTIPANLGNLKYLYWLELSGNQIEATVDVDWDFLTSLTNCSQLVILSLESNRLSGNLPTSLANFSSTLNHVLLGWNQISGTIPVNIGNLFNLTDISVKGNNLTGSIPSTIGELRNLSLLDLSGNFFIGQVPDSIGNLTQLINLRLERNDLNGSIPPSIGSLTNLQELDLSQNRLSGSIPKELLTLSSLSIRLDLSNNLFSGPVPSEVGRLTHLNEFAVSDNKLSGKIPSALGNCQSLEHLSLQGNAFEGTIPQSLSNLKGLQELDLSSNNLSGEIPDFLAQLRALMLLNLSYNSFEGELPHEGVFRNASAISLLGDNRLCGGSPLLHLPQCLALSTRKKHLSLALKVIIPVLSVVAFVLISLFVYAVIRRMKTLLRKPSLGPLLGEQFTRVSYADLLKATDGFSSSNLIGSGSFGFVYKGSLESDEKVAVAVKVLNLQIQGASNSFIAECETLKNVRHRNLVKVLTACSGVDFKGNDFKALVLTYMANGSLENWLHPEASETKTLALIQRLNIAIDVASALEYLHHHGHRPIVHCDLKPSNVLLDEDLRAYVSDFGLARFLLDEVSKAQKHQTASIGIKGTIGYVAPEYGMHGHTSSLGDVYSYGILLLELFTGRRPTDDMFKDGLVLHKYVEMAVPNRVLDIVDPRIFSARDNKEINEDIQHSNEVEVEDAQCLDSLMRLGLKCSNDDPRERMKMEDVSKELHAIRNTLGARIN